jgi:hypothetical protein
MSRFGSQDYPIGRGTGVCAASGRRLEPGERFVAALVESDESEELHRIDFGAQAWDDGARPARLFGFWRGTVPAADAKKQVLIDDDSILDLFEQLAAATDDRRVAFRFVLALILVRKRLLVCESTRAPRAGEPGVMLVRRRGDPRPPEGPALAEVIDPGMTDEAIDEVILQFEAVMAGEAVGGTAAPAAGTAGEVVGGGGGGT